MNIAQLQVVEDTGFLAHIRHRLAYGSQFWDTSPKKAQTASGSGTATPAWTVDVLSDAQASKTTSALPHLPVQAGASTLQPGLHLDPELMKSLGLAP